MPVYNGEEFLRQALDSLLSQTFTDFELIISDNASTDSTEVICKEYAARDQRVRYYRNETNIGGARNFNRVFELAQGNYFKWAAHDDICEPTFLARCVDVLDSDRSVILAYSQTRVIDWKGNPVKGMVDAPKKLDSWKPHERYRYILLKTFWSYEAFGLIRADILRKTSLHGSYHGSDRVLLAELSLMGRFMEIPEALFLRRCHLHQGSSLKSKNARSSWLNPNGSQQLKLHIPRGSIGYFKALFKVPLAWDERFRALLVLLKYTSHRKTWQVFLAGGSSRKLKKANKAQSTLAETSCANERQLPENPASSPETLISGPQLQPIVSQN